jgi:hypothetical protein
VEKLKTGGQVLTLGNLEEVSVFACEVWMHRNLQKEATNQAIEHLEKTKRKNIKSAQQERTN